MQDETIMLGHGAGGRLSRILTEKLFLKHFSNNYLELLHDSSVVETGAHTAFTTDSYVIDPLFFPGGDIGKLAVCGTVNDLLVSGSVPKYLSVGFIIEEGLPIRILERIIESMAETAKSACIKIVTGDTKVVKKGQCDKVYINTSGMGLGIDNASHLWKTPELQAGDMIIVSGFLGDHAATIMASRNNINFEKEIFSDVAPLTELILPLIEEYAGVIRFMRDITRGGLTSVLNELCNNRDTGIEINEKDIPVREEIQGLCEIFGYDPLYLANEGKIVIVAEKETAGKMLKKIQQLAHGENAAIIGEVTHKHNGKVVLKSVAGGSRIIDMLSGEMLPRIC